MADELPSAEDAFGPEPNPASATTSKTEPKAHELPDAESVFGPAPGSGFLGQLRSLDSKYLGGFGRQAILAARAVPDAAVSLATMAPDAVSSTYQYGKDLANGRSPSLQDWNPWSPKGGYANPNLANNQIASALDTVLPHPETTTERIAHFVESGLSGAKLPLAPGMPSSRPMTPGAAPAVPAQADDSLFQQVRNAMSNAPPPRSGINPGDTATALEKLKARLSRDGRPWEQATQDVQEANAAGVPMRLTDAGPNTLTTGEVLAQKPGPGAAIMANDREAIQADTKIRVPAQVRNALDTTQDAGKYADLLRQTRGQHADVNYEAVRQDSTPVTDPEVWNLLEDPVVAKIYQGGRDADDVNRQMGARIGITSPPRAEIYAPKPTGSNNMPAIPGQAAPEPEWVMTGHAPDVQSLDYLQRELNSRATGLFQDARNGVAGAGRQAELLTKYRDILMERLKAISPAFDKASTTFAGDSRIISANQVGAGTHPKLPSYIELDPAQASEYVSKLSPAELDALRTGFVDSLLKRPELSGNGSNIAKSVLGGPRMQALLKPLFGDDPTKYETFAKWMGAESRIFNNTGQILRGSQTFKRMEAAKDFENEGLNRVGRVATILSQIHHQWLGAAGHSLIKLMERPTWNEGAATQAAKILSSDDPQAMAEGLQAMERGMTAGTPPRGTQAALTATRSAIAALSTKYQPPPSDQSTSAQP